MTNVEEKEAAQTNQTPPVWKNPGEFWNSYVRDWQPGQQQCWPGDEWGGGWNVIFTEMLAKELDVNCSRFVEIGGGSGKYAQMVLDHFPQAHLINFDVSREFLEVFDKRLSSYAPRVASVALNDSPTRLSEHLHEIKWAGTLDCLFSIDAMVHVDLQVLIAYLITAAHTLKIGGKLALTLANATSTAGFDKLIQDIPIYFSYHGAYQEQFRWLCPDLVGQVLHSLGFGEVQFLDQEPASPLFGYRDICVVASLTKRPFWSLY